METKISGLPEICACSDGTYTNSTCPEVEPNNITMINIHGLNSNEKKYMNLILFSFKARRLVAVCEHSYCGNDGVCIVIDSTFGCICPDGGISEKCAANTANQPAVPSKEKISKVFI